MRQAILGLLIGAVLGAPANAQHAGHGPSPPRLPMDRQTMHEMPDAATTMPKLAPTRVFQVSQNIDWTANTGFGTESSWVAMMNLMMVGGSGYENMRMEPRKPGEVSGHDSHAGHAMPGMAAPADGSAPEATVTPNPPVVGDNTVTVTVRDGQGNPRPGLKLQAAVFMTNMDMGTARPPVKDLGGGRYQVVAPFTMAGPWRVTLSGEGVNLALDFSAGGKERWRPGTAAPEPTLADLMNSHLDERDRPVGLLPSGPVNGGHAAHASPPAMKQPEAAAHDAHVETPRPPATPAVNVAAYISQPKVGDNVLDIRLTDAHEKPVIGAKVAVSVAMTNMDMGTARLAAKELGGGRYRATVNFSMAGPWRVTLTVMPPNGPTTAKPFDFQTR